MERKLCSHPGSNLSPCEYFSFPPSFVSSSTNKQPRNRKSSALFTSMKEQDKPNIPNPFPFFPATEGTSKKAVAQSDVVRGGNLVDASFANKIDPYQRPAGQNPSAGLTHGSSSETEEHAAKRQCSSVSSEDQREAREAPKGQQVSPEVVRQSSLTERTGSKPSDLLPQLKPGMERQARTPSHIELIGLLIEPKKVPSTLARTAPLQSIPKVLEWRANSVPCLSLHIGRQKESLRCISHRLRSQLSKLKP